MKPTVNGKTIKKFWISKEKGTDSIILIANEMIYKGNKKPSQIDESISKIYNDKIPKDLFSLPFGYINKIQLQEGKKQISITFNKDSNDLIRIEDESKRKEVFDYLKNNIDNIKYKYIEYSKFKTIRKPLIALGILSLLCIWAYFVADMLEKGEDVGTQLVLVLFFAGLGTQLLLIVYGAIITICAISIGLKLKNPPKIHELSF